MKISTLEFIHNLLRAEATRADEVYKAARKLQHEYEESETASEGLVKRQTEAADEYMHERFAADSALEDFEAQEW